MLTHPCAMPWDVPAVVMELPPIPSLLMGSVWVPTGWLVPRDGDISLGHHQFNFTVFHHTTSSELGAVSSLWNKCQNHHPVALPCSYHHM